MKEIALKEAAGTFIYCLETERFLFNLRSLIVPSAGTWSLFGGWHNGNESLVQTVIREVIEETEYCLYSEDIHFLSLDRYEDSKKAYSTYISYVDTEFTPILSDESSGFVWCTLEDRPEELHYGLSQVLRKLQDTSSTWYKPKR